MNRYLVAKTAAIIFGLITVVLFYWTWTGQYFDIVGSIGLGVAIYLINMLLLVISFSRFIWLRSRKDLASRSESELLDAWAKLDGEDGPKQQSD